MVHPRGPVEEGDSGRRDRTCLEVVDGAVVRWWLEVDLRWTMASGN